MAAIYARARSKEAPMVGIEFTNRTRTIPAWRMEQEKENANNVPAKRTQLSYLRIVPPKYEGTC